MMNVLHLFFWMPLLLPSRLFSNLLFYIVGLHFLYALFHSLPKDQRYAFIEFGSCCNVVTWTSFILPFGQFSGLLFDICCIPFF